MFDTLLEIFSLTKLSYQCSSECPDSVVRYFSKIYERLLILCFRICNNMFSHDAEVPSTSKMSKVKMKVKPLPDMCRK